MIQYKNNIGCKRGLLVKHTQLFYIICLILLCSRDVTAINTNEYQCQSNTQISISECQTLINIYHATHGNEWKNSNSNNWLKTDRPCEWEGVSCWKNHVTRLEFINQFLSGKLPDISQLSYLQKLTLIKNPSLSGSLPSLKKLKNLTHLVIFDTSISGFLPKFDDLRQLTSAVLFNNDFIGPIPQSEQLNQLVIFGNRLCISPQIDYSKWQHRVNMYLPCEPMLTNTIKGVLNPEQFGARSDDGFDDAVALNEALAILQLSLSENEPLSNLEIQFSAGEYLFENSLKISNFDNLSIIGKDSKRKITQIKKSSKFSASDHRSGALVNIRFGNNLFVKGIHFLGQLKSTDTASLWYDNGIYLGSTNHIVIENNRFSNFGDAAILSTTDADDQTGKIGSSDLKIIKNYFKNIFQTSTTSPKGGVSLLLFEDNHVEHLKGSIKFATRKAGAEYINILDNSIKAAGSNTKFQFNHGIEVEGYRNVLIKNNDIQSGRGVGIVVRSPQSIKTDTFDWWNISIVNNHVRDFRQGLVISNLANASTGILPKATGIHIFDNQFSQLWGAGTLPAIHVVGSNIDNSSIINNKIYGGNYAIWPSSINPEKILIKGNKHFME